MRDRALSSDTSLGVCTARMAPNGAIDEAYLRLLPGGANTVTADEAAMLAAVFGDDGELPARRM